MQLNQMGAIQLLDIGGVFFEMDTAQLLEIRAGLLLEIRTAHFFRDG